MTPMVAGQSGGVLRGRGESPLSGRDLQVLVSLAKIPLRSQTVADVARVTDLPATTAGRILRRLHDGDLVTVAGGDAAKRGGHGGGMAWALNFCPGLMRISPAKSKGGLKEPSDRGPVPARVVPHRFWHHFGDTNPRHLVLPRDARLVAQRLLGSDDPEAFGWALVNLPAATLHGYARSTRTDARTRSRIREGLSERARSHQQGIAGFGLSRLACAGDAPVG